MNKRIISLALAFVLIFTSVLGANAAYYLPGPKTYDMEAKYCIENSGAEISGTKITATGTASLTYDYYISYAAGSIDFIYASGSEGTITVSPLGSEEKTLALNRMRLRLPTPSIVLSLQGTMS